jgi:hypothetical protein
VLEIAEISGLLLVPKECKMPFKIAVGAGLSLCIFLLSTGLQQLTVISVMFCTKVVVAVAT